MIDNANINLRDPVNRKHPLNQGRLAWWLGVRGLSGGPALYDIMGRYPATLAAGCDYATSAQNGYPEIVSSGATNGVATCGQPTQAIDNFTLAISFVLPVISGVVDTEYLIYNGNPVTGWGLAAQVYSSAYIGFYFNGASGYYSGAGIAPVANTPYRVHMTLAAGLATLYINGDVISTYAPGTLVTPTAGDFGIGLVPGIGKGTTGRVWNSSLWSRPLSAAEVMEDYRQELAGYRDVLNFTSRPMASPTATYVTIIPATIGSAEAWGSVVIASSSGGYAPTLLVAAVSALPLASDPAWTTVINL